MNTDEHWIKSLLVFGQDAKWKIILSVVLSIISVFSGLVPYWTVYKTILLMIDGNTEMNQVIYYISIKRCLCDTGYLFRKFDDVIACDGL